MKKIKTSSYLLQLVVLVAVLLLFTECNNNAQAKKDFSTFVATLVFFIYMFLGGIPALIFTAIGVNSTKPAIKVLSIVFLSVFGLFSLIGISMYSRFWMVGSEEWIGMLILIHYGTLLTSVILMVLGANNRAKAIQESQKESLPKATPVAKRKPDDDIDYMNEILND